jgi:hypothetical protein
MPLVVSAPVLFGTRTRSPETQATQRKQPTLPGLRSTAAVPPCPTLAGLMANQGGART